MLINFRCQKTSFLYKHIFLVDYEKYTQWNLDTKVKVFHESISCFMKCSWNCISWNALKEIFHSVSLPSEHLFWRVVIYRSLINTYLHPPTPNQKKVIPTQIRPHPAKKEVTLTHTKANKGLKHPYPPTLSQEMVTPTHT